MFIEHFEDQEVRKRWEEIKRNFQDAFSGKIQLNGDSELSRLLLRHRADVRAYSIPLGKDVQIDERISSLNAVLPFQIVEHYIRTASHICLANFCGCREMHECTKHPIGLGCIFLGRAAKDISPELGRPGTVDEALERVQAWKENGFTCNLGFVPADAEHYQVLPPDRFMAVCGCCSCCCISQKTRELDRQIGLVRSVDTGPRLPGVNVKVDQEKCVGCGECVNNCMYGGMALHEGKATVADSCYACGMCFDRCPTGAITLGIEDVAYFDRVLSALAEKVNVT